MSKTGDWLANLEEYPCDTCGNHSIFKNQCSDCNTFETNKHMLNELEQEMEQINKDIVDLIDKLEGKEEELTELEKYFKDKKEKT